VHKIFAAVLFIDGGATTIFSSECNTTKFIARK